MAVTAEELEREIVSKKALYAANTRIYMTGSNPFALSVDKLKEYLGVLRGHFPHFERISMQARIDDISRKSGAELSELGGLGLNHLYIGAENGNEAALELMDKGHTAADTLEQLWRLDEAGITYTVFYIIGMGGRGMGVASGEATAKLFNRAHPQRITTTGLTVFPNTPLAEMQGRGEFIEAPEREKIEELRAFLETLNIDVIYDGFHYLNSLNYRFANFDGAAKSEALEDIDEVLKSCPDEELEMMVNRKLKLSL